MDGSIAPYEVLVFLLRTFIVKPLTFTESFYILKNNNEVQNYENLVPPCIDRISEYDILSYVNMPGFTRIHSYVLYSLYIQLRYSAKPGKLLQIFFFRVMTNE